MADLTYVKFYSLLEAVFEKKHDMSSDVLKIMLTNVAPVLTNTVKANLTEIAAGNGYTAGGETVAITSSSQTTGTYSLVVTSDITWTAAGGAIAAFRYVVLYNDTATNDELIGYWDIGSEKNLSDTDSYKLNLAGQTLITGS